MRSLTLRVGILLIVAITIGLEIVYPSNPLTEMVVWLGRSVIIAYAVMLVIIWLSGRTVHWLEGIAGVGGLLYLIGVQLWMNNDTAAPDLDLMLRVIGVAFMIMPLMWTMTRSAVQNR